MKVGLSDTRDDVAAVAGRLRGLGLVDGTVIEDIIREVFGGTQGSAARP